MAVRQIRQLNRRTGTVYVYEAEAYWDKDKKQSRYRGRKMIGHIDPDTGELVPNRPMRASPAAPTSRRLFTGATSLLTQLADQAGLAEDLAAALGEEDAKAVLSLAQFLVLEDPAPMSRFARWARAHTHPLGVELSSQRTSELLASVTEPRTEALFKARIARASGEYWFFDTTSISSYSELLERVKWGRNKDRVPLPQVNLAVVKDSGTGLPVAYRDIPGQITDVTLVKHLVAAFKLLGADKPKACMDRGFYSEANVNALIDAHIKFIVAVPFVPAWAGQAIEDRAAEVKRWANWDKHLGVYAARFDHPWARTVKDPAAGAKTIETKRAYLHIFYDPERAISQAHRLTEVLSELHAELTAGKPRQDHEALCERYFTRTKAGWEGREDVIDAERARAGWQVLISNDANLTASGALALYRSKDQIEKAFHDVKDRLDFRTPKVHSHQTLSGKLLVVFAALILTSELCRRIGAAGLRPAWTMREILDELESVERYEHDGREPVVCHLTKKQKDLYRDLGAKPPA
jgi:hypothetical protein